MGKKHLNTNLTRRMMFSNRLVAFVLILAVNLQTSLGSVAIGVGTRNPANANECLDPDTGLNHTIGTAWKLPGICGEAHCELRGENVYISYAFCGSAYAEHPCYLTAEPELPYPYCCPRSFCPSDLDIATNEIDTEYYDDELQMAANDMSNSVRIKAPDSFKKHDSDIKNHENVVSYNVDMKNSFEEDEYQLDWDTSLELLILNSYCISRYSSRKETI